MSAVPVSVMAHDGRPGAAAVPCAVQLIAEPTRKARAVPVTWRLPAHVALNAPLALLPDCSVTSHLKSVHVEAAGMMLPDVQLPTSALRPEALGPTVLSRSNPRQPAAPTADARASANARFLCFMTMTCAKAASWAAGVCSCYRIGGVRLTAGGRSRLYRPINAVPSSA